MLHFDNNFLEFIPDAESLFTLLLTIFWIIVLIWKYKIHESLLTKFREVPSYKKFTLFPLLLIGLLSLWMTIRSIGLYFKVFLASNFYYTDDILILLSWLLTTNLCFTLFNALTIKPDELDANIKGMINVSIQAIVIGVITFLPRNSIVQLARIGGAINYMMILIGLIISLTMLIFIKDKLTKRALFFTVVRFGVDTQNKRLKDLVHEWRCARALHIRNF